MMTTSTDIISLSHAETLVYAYPNPYGDKPNELEVEAPKSFRVAPDGSHETTDMGGYGVVMARDGCRSASIPTKTASRFGIKLLARYFDFLSD